MIRETLLQADDLMKKSIEKMKKEFSSLRTNRAHSSLLEGIKVDAYNSTVPVNQVAGISIPDAMTLEIRPWDASVLPAIEKALYASSLGITPMNDGKCIKLRIPPLSEERRKELCKFAGKIAEDFRVSVRNDRHKLLEALKKAEKDKKITEDDRFKTEEQLQKITDKYISEIDALSASKEKEIMTQ